MSNLDILSPHYDDAVLSAWHQIEHPHSRVVTLFGGIPDKPVSGIWDKLSTSAKGTETVGVRRLENEAALASSATFAVNLDFLDRQYQPFTSRTIADIADEVENAAAEDTTFLAPLGIGSNFRSHPDHVDARKTGIELMRRGHDVSFYADLPYLLPIRNLAEWPSRLSSRRIKNILGRHVDIESHELSIDEQKRKREALSKFTTQMPMVNKLAFGALKNADAYKWEVVIHPE